MRRPIKSPFHRPDMQTLERLQSRRYWRTRKFTLKAVTKMPDPTYILRRIAVKRRQAKWFKRGTVPGKRGPTFLAPL
jgi:hypothetical protein